MKEKKLEDIIDFQIVFYTIWGWSMFVLVNGILLFTLPIIVVITLPFDRDKKILTYVVKFFCELFYIINIPERNNINKNNIKTPKKGERRIYVLNHASLFDVILMHSLPGPIKSVMKESYAKIPVIGWIAMLTGNIMVPVEDNDERKVSVYYKIIDKLERGNPIVIFPEGTRSKTSKIGRFYQGTFKIALDTKSDLVPVAFDTWNVIRPKAFWIRDVKPTFRVLDVVPYEEIKHMDYKQISKKMRIILLEGLLNLRDERRLNDKRYYRHIDKYKKIDDEMKNDLENLKKEYHNCYLNKN